MPIPEAAKAQKWKASLARVSTATVAFHQKESVAARLGKRVDDLEAQLSEARADLTENETQRVAAKKELEQATDDRR